MSIEDVHKQSHAIVLTVLPINPTIFPFIYLVFPILFCHMKCMQKYTYEFIIEFWFKFRTLRRFWERDKENSQPIYENKKNKNYCVECWKPQKSIWKCNIPRIRISLQDTHVNKFFFFFVRNICSCAFKYKILSIKFS